LEDEGSTVQNSIRPSLRCRIQELYKKGTALGIFWGLAFAIFDFLIKISPLAPFYTHFVNTVTTPLYTQWTEFTANSPFLLWFSNSLTTIIYFILGYGVKVTGSALVSCWLCLLNKIK